MSRLRAFLILPAEITDFERGYLARVNRVALLFLAAHVPVLAFIAWLNGTGVTTAVVLSTAVFAGPFCAHFVVRNLRTRSVIKAVAAVFMGGLLIHVGQGPVQIEMHFYLFAVIAMCCVFANPLVIVAATVTVALHHLIIWLVLPRSVFNYEAAWWVPAIHAGFIVLESVTACFIARVFFDSVMGLERAVGARTSALDAKNRDMRLLLDNVQQGFLTIDRAGTLAAERSAAVDRWFGSPAVDASWFTHLGTVSKEFEAGSRCAWEEVASGVLPLELALGQMPCSVERGSSTYSIEYRPIGTAEMPDHFLVIVTDVTGELARQLAEQERRDTLALFEQLHVDRAGMASFLSEGSTILENVTNGATALATAQRLVHTMKGNAALYGLDGIASLCNELEDWIVEHQATPTLAACATLQKRWTCMQESAVRMVGADVRLELDELMLRRLEDAVSRGAATRKLVELAAQLRLESTRLRLERFGDQARQIADRIGKRDLRVVIEHHDVRLDPHRWADFWGSFVHAIRNSLDHGVESSDERVAAGKQPYGTLTLRTRPTPIGLLIEIEDDGRGVDWEAVRANAERAGLPCETQENLERALFYDGLSTASFSAPLSGRGVGMGALLDATRARDGVVRVRSTPGRGTVVAMHFPNSGGRIAQGS